MPIIRANMQGGHVAGLALLVLLGLAGVSAEGAKVLLRIRAGNPIDQEQPVQIRSNLPAGITTNDVLSLGGLELGYDYKTGLLYVHKDMVLAPRQILVFDVELDDIWVVPAEQLDRFQAHAQSLEGKLREHSRYARNGGALLARVTTALKDVRQRQDANAIGTGVQPIDHIRAYEANMDALKAVRTDLGLMENLVLFTNQDPGALMGEDPTVPKPEDAGRAAGDTGKIASILFTVENPSRTRRRENFPFRRNLPREIRPQDVLDTGGLGLGLDEKEDVAYVYAEGLTIDPGATLTFNVKIKDRWDVNGPRMSALQTEATNLLAKVSARGDFVSVEEKLAALIEQLGELKAETGPTELNAAYVKFFRQQTDRLDIIEQEIQRIVINLPQIDRQTRFGFTPQAPTMKTTWLVIWVILGFLGLFSIVFFARWSGRSKAENLDDSGNVAP